MILLTDITKIYPLGKGNTVPAVRGVGLSIAQGEFMIIVGRSGSGKTTLLNLMAGLTRPTSGQVMLDGVNLWELSDAEQSALRCHKFGFVFQFSSLLPSLNAQENVVLPTVFGSNGNRAASHERAAELLRQVGLEDKLTAYPRQLSAGQQQRVVIARALMNRPQVLLADEPTSNLDERTELEIMDLFHQLHQSLGITIVMVTHTRQLITYGTHPVEMAEGRITNGRVSELAGPGSSESAIL
jgi:ABC-type lipoprotein export system ATPase subunit